MNGMILFESFSIRRARVDGITYFSIVDVVRALTESPDPREYWQKIKLRDEVLSSNETPPIWWQLKMISTDGKNRKTDVATLENMFRIIQSIPSQKAEPFKRWLAQVGNERVEEHKDPSKAIDRAINRYKKMGKSDDFINERLKGISGRKILASKWKDLGVHEPYQYALLTNDMTNQAFGMKVREYEEFKRVGKNQLRDNMNPLELIVNSAMEAVTLQLHKQNNSYGLHELRDDATRGGRMAKKIREDMEKELGRSIITSTNYLPKG